MNEATEDDMKTHEVFRIVVKEDGKMVLAGLVEPQAPQGDNEAIVIAGVISVLWNGSEKVREQFKALIHACGEAMLASQVGDEVASTAIYVEEPLQ